jgi:hypothetical protein
MTITFETDDEVIVYAFEKVISYARRTQQVFVAQCVWWLVSLIGLEQGLVNYIDRLNERTIDSRNLIPEETNSPGDRDASITRRTVTEGNKVPLGVSPTPRDLEEDKRTSTILEECEEYLKDSRRLREIAALKATGRTLTGRINPTPISKKYLRKKDRASRKQPKQKKVHPGTEGIESSEIERRRVTGKCLRCAWPIDRKGAHQVKDCRRPIKLNRGTASYPKAKDYQEFEEFYKQPVLEESIGDALSSVCPSVDSS